MIYLIDGHNLIGRLPDIDLADPDDEEQLVRRLSDWVRLDSRRQIRLFFDAGPAGGTGGFLTGPRVRVRFSRVGQSADDLLKRELRGVKNPPEYTLVTSDQAVLAAARQARVGYILSEEFARLLAEELAAPTKPPAEAEAAAADPEMADEPALSAEEVALWLDLFEKAPRLEPPPTPPTLPTRSPAAPRPTPEKPPRPLTPEELKNGLARLSAADLAEWLSLFAEGDAPAGGESAPPAEKSAGRRPSIDKQEGVSDEDLDTWTRYLGEDG